jgi:5-dehydro-2-deoxygluconokinase
MSAGARSRPLLCLGQAGVDLLGDPPDHTLAEVRRWIPQLGGTVAAVGERVARLGSAVRLAGTVGEDEWGGWVRAQLAQTGVDVSGLRALPGVPTPLAFVGLDSAGAPARRRVFTPRETLDAALGDDVAELVEAADALLIGTDALAGPGERALTMWARERALALGRPVLIEADLELDRWPSRADAAASANACVPGATLVLVGEADAAVLTGEEDPERAALALRKAGARLVAIRRAGGGALLRGAERAQVAPPADRPGEPVTAAHTLTAAHAFAAVLVHRLLASRFYPAAVAAALPGAVGVAAGVAAAGPRRAGAVG